MSWRFWQPKHTVESIAHRLADGLRNGSVGLDDPLEDCASEDDIDSSDIVMELEVANDMSDAAILEMVKQYASTADAENRSQGGVGLRIGRVVFETSNVKIALRPRTDLQQFNF